MLSLSLLPGRLEAGCDEVGRGCLAGPVYAAAVILPPDLDVSRSELRRLNDSKQLSEKARYELRPVIEREALAWAVGVVDNREIDEINILRASILAMHRALDQLKTRPEFILVDGNRFYTYHEPSTGTAVPHQTIVKGDGKMMAIAAASILAKTYRDDYMTQLHEEFPAYHWDENKGYPSVAHRDAIRRFGTTPHHRLTFQLLPPTQLEFDFPE
jgi:ribonuclease HII